MIWLPGVLSQDNNVKLPPIGTALNDCTWEQIRAISDAGKAVEYFNVGDRKAVTLNGTVGNCTFSNESYYCYILGFDHNAEIEGNKRIHIQFCHTALEDGKHLGFIDSSYGNTKTTGDWFNISSFDQYGGADSFVGGWEGSNMRNKICAAFENVLPIDLKTVLKTITKYSDNYGRGKGLETSVTATTERVFLLSEFEVFGTQTSGNPYEKNYQQRYDYYGAGNARDRYRHSLKSYKAAWWLRSASGTQVTSWCQVDTSGNVTEQYANGTWAFAPCICV